MTVYFYFFFFTFKSFSGSTFDILLSYFIWKLENPVILPNQSGRSCLLQRSHARHAALSTALIQTWMDQSETPLLFFAETNQRQSCSRVPQSSWSLSSTCAEELWVKIASATWPHGRKHRRSIFTLARVTSGRRSWPKERLLLKLSNREI